MNTNNVKSEEAANYKTKAARKDKAGAIIQAKREDGIIAQALQILAARHAPGACLTNPTDTVDYLTVLYGDYEHEIFGCIFLDNRNRVIAYEALFAGTVDGASVYPREVVKAALRHNAAAIMFYHNHPSGNTEPSSADIAITERLKKALALVDVRTLDHIVIGASGCLCFSERGLL